MTVTITPEQRKNLAKLATFLSTNTDLAFDMRTFRGEVDEDGDVHREYSVRDHPCGSVGCAVGHGPAAGIPAIDQENNWHSYAVRAFGADGRRYNPVWDGLFEADWAEVDNTAKGAAQRINRFLETGELYDFQGSRLA